MAPCIQLHTPMNKIKLETPGSVNNYIGMAGGDSAGACNFSLDSAVRGYCIYKSVWNLHLEFHVWMIIEIKAA